MLEHGCHRDRMNACLPGFQRLAVVAKRTVSLPGGHQLHDVHLRATHLDVDIQPRCFIQTFGLRVVKTPVFRLSVPVSDECEFLFRHAGGGNPGQQQGKEGIRRCTPYFHRKGSFI
ncbi:Uncharacterised protein [Raoultella terrigena]|uniref:Uncharacterized protein n=1 Tax=Raoultella terrigena TaxID=577 RepID=A0A4U9CXS5_RAOTE|nr:Uncharacterised protein [Raoultella terrigena]